MTAQNGSTVADFNRLAQLRVGSHWGSRAALSRLLGVSPRMISYWRASESNGRRIPAWVFEVLNGQLDIKQKELETRQTSESEKE